MSKQRLNHLKPAAICAAMAMMLAQVMGVSGITTRASASSPFTVVGLSSETRVLDSFVTDLARFDKRSAELHKKASVSRTEFDSIRATADDLKRRLTGVQNSLRQMVSKLKAAGQWESLDQAVLAKISDARFQELVRREGFKKILEEAATALSNDASQISAPLDALRNKVQTTASEPGATSPASHAVRAAYSPARAVFALDLRCRLASIRLAVNGLFRGGTPEARANFNCKCFGQNCDGPPTS
ncbi:MAG TPA: hypothetical protein VNO14_08245 [Blastocatellia bacterium]|nr:hypothetical protein [Blastocatellia bacterium]